MMGMAMMASGQASSAHVASGVLIDIVGTGPGGVTGTITFNPDGSISGGITGAGAGPTTPIASAWYTVVGGTPGSGFWIKFTPTSGTLTTNGAATFSQLSSSRSAIKSITGGVTTDVVYKVEISSDSGGVTIVATYNNFEIEIN